MSRISAVERGAAVLLRRGFRFTRGVVPARGRRLLAPVASRVYRGINGLERSAFRDEEERLRALLDREPENGPAWYELGLVLDARGQHDEAIDALLRAAETGPLFSLVSQTLQTRMPIRDLVNQPVHQERVRRMVERQPESAELQLLAGAFMLDRGERASGRAFVRRGYEMQLSDRPGALATDDDERAALPTFLIIGPHKTATTSLHAFLVQHPRVVATPRKELHFWGKQHGRADELYLDYFPPLARGSDLITGEATANYLQTPEAAAAAAERFPHVKTIVLRRDPVARAYSHYQMIRRLRNESREFEQAVADEQALLGGRPPLTQDELPERGGSYLLGSCILPYLRMWTEAIDPRQVMVIDSAYFSEHRQETVDAVSAYLGLEPARVEDQSDRNVGAYSGIPADTEARLREWFEPHERALDAFLAEHPATIPAGPGAIG